MLLRLTVIRERKLVKYSPKSLANTSIFRYDVEQPKPFCSLETLTDCLLFILQDNGTTVIYTNVTLGVQSLVPIPVTFSGQVYVDFNTDCRIYGVRAYAEM